MKKLSILIFFLSFSVNAQYVNGKPVSELKNNYKCIEVITTHKGTKPDIRYVMVMFGQVSKVKDLKKSILYKGELPQEEMTFIQNVSVLNFFYENGYRLHTEKGDNFILERIED